MGALLFWKRNIILTQLRCFVSFFNYDLFQVNIVSDPSCRCGANREDSYHFFFDCSHYANMRYKLFHNLSWLPNDCAIDLKLLTSGNPIFSNEQNEVIFKHVFIITFLVLNMILVTNCILDVKEQSLLKSRWLTSRQLNVILSTELRNKKDSRQVPKHFEIGPRKLNIALTQLRCFA
jgi:hypothetical protein